MFAVLHIILIIGCLMARFLVIDHLDFSADPEEFAPVIALFDRRAHNAVFCDFLWMLYHVRRPVL